MLNHHNIIHSAKKKPDPYIQLNSLIYNYMIKYLLLKIISVEEESRQVTISGNPRTRQSMASRGSNETQMIRFTTKYKMNQFLVFLTFPTRKMDPKLNKFEAPLEMQGVSTFKTGLTRRPSP